MYANSWRASLTSRERSFADAVATLWAFHTSLDISVSYLGIGTDGVRISLRYVRLESLTSSQYSLGPAAFPDNRDTSVLALRVGYRRHDRGQ
jgi:hypothetical protein